MPIFLIKIIAQIGKIITTKNLERTHRRNYYCSHVITLMILSVSICQLKSIVRPLILMFPNSDKLNNFQLNSPMGVRSACSVNNVYFWSGFSFLILVIFCASLGLRKANFQLCLEDRVRCSRTSNLVLWVSLELLCHMVPVTSFSSRHRYTDRPPLITWVKTLGLKNHQDLVSTSYSTNHTYWKSHNVTTFGPRVVQAPNWYDTCRMNFLARFYSFLIEHFLVFQTSSYQLNKQF